MELGHPCPVSFIADTDPFKRIVYARILAVVCVYGNNEFMIYNPKCVEEIAHIQRAYHIQGGETPDAEIVPLIRKYVKELERAKKSPEWAKKLFKDRYGIKLMNE